MRLRKNWLPGILAAMIPLFGYGQETSQPLRLSLQQAIELGLKNRPDLQNQQLHIRIAQNNIRRNRSEYLPSVEASADFRYNTQLASTVLPEGFFGPGNGSQLIRFGTRYNSVLALNATQPLFNAQANQDVKIARKNTEIEQEKWQQVKAESKLKISEAYYAVLLRNQEVSIASKTVERVRKYVEVTTAKLDLGSIQENDLNQVKLDFQNADLTLKQARQNLQLSLQNLNNTLYLNASQVIELTDSLYTSNTVAGRIEEVELPAESRSEVRQRKLEGDLSSLQFKKAASGAYPTLSAYANYSTQYQNNALDLTGKNAWTPFNYVGIRLVVPVFNGNAARLEKQEYRLRQEISQNSLIQQKREISDEIQTARTELLNAQLNLEYARQNYALAESIYAVNLKKYELGNLLYTGLLDIEKSLTEAEKNLTTQTYELLMAKLRWQRASGE